MSKLTALLRRLAPTRLLELSKDGGEYSTVWAYTLIEVKWAFTIVLLRFENGSRDAYHDHAFDCISWLLSGGLVEDRIAGATSSAGGTHQEAVRHEVHSYLPGPYPIITRRSHLHKVTSVGRSWVFSIRGPWSRTWHERAAGADSTPITLTHGRKEVAP